MGALSPLVVVRGIDQAVSSRPAALCAGPRGLSARIEAHDGPRDSQAPGHGPRNGRSHRARPQDAPTKPDRPDCRSKDRTRKAQAIPQGQCRRAGPCRRRKAPNTRRQRTGDPRTRIGQGHGRQKRRASEREPRPSARIHLHNAIDDAWRIASSKRHENEKRGKRCRVLPSPPGTLCGSGLHDRGDDDRQRPVRRVAGLRPDPGTRYGIPMPVPTGHRPTARPSGPTALSRPNGIRVMPPPAKPNAKNPAGSAATPFFLRSSPFRLRCRAPLPSALAVCPVGQGRGVGEIARSMSRPGSVLAALLE